MKTVATTPLSLQGIELDQLTPADVYRSANSAYVCAAMSVYSIGC